MNNDTNEVPYRLIALILVVLLVLVTIKAALASDDDDGQSQWQTQTQGQNQSATANVTDSSVVSQTVEGGSYSSRAYGFSHSLGDVDINQCIVSKQTGTFIVSWQGYDYNLWCMGEVFDSKGLWDMGALMRCDIPVIRSHFETDYDCLQANTVDQEVIESPKLTELYKQAARFDEHSESEERHETELTLMLQEQAVLFDRLDQHEARLAQRPEPVYVPQEPRISEDQMERAWQIIKGAVGEPEK